MKYLLFGCPWRAMSALQIFSLAGRTAVVTGASSGLGKHMALTLCNAGAKVGLIARRRSQLDAVHAQIRAAGGDSHVVTLDLTDLGAIDGALSEIEGVLGPIGVLVNNAGLSIEGKALDLTPDDYDKVLNVNTRAPFFMAQAVARRMVAAETGGSIINIASLISLKVEAHVALPHNPHCHSPFPQPMVVDACLSLLAGGEQPIDICNEQGCARPHDACPCARVGSAWNPSE